MTGSRATIRAAVLLCVGVIAGCTAGTPTSPPLPAPSLGATPSPSGSSSSASGPTPAASVPPRATFVPAPGLAWHKLAVTGLRSGADGAVATTDSYVAYGSDATGSWAARSEDGQVWTTASLSAPVKPCPSYEAQPDSSVFGGATDGLGIVLVGIEYAADVTPCGTQEAVAWISVDGGRSWQRSDGFGAIDGFAEATEVWAVPGGWEAHVTTSTTTGIGSIWGSADGLHWHRNRLVTSGPGGDLSATFAVAPNGTRLLARFNGDTAVPDVVDGLAGGDSSLETSSDGVAWRPVGLALPNGRGVVAGGIRPPGPVGPDQWQLLTMAESEPAITWVSADLSDWRQAAFPRADVGRIAVTRYGYLTTGADLCGDGGTCDPGLRQYLTTDGLAWSAFPAAGSYPIAIDGPAGVIGLSGRAEAGRLGP